VDINVGAQEVRFLVPDMSRFDEQELKDAFKKREFDKVEVVRKSNK
jgi:hypothetical protein